MMSINRLRRTIFIAAFFLISLSITASAFADERVTTPQNASNIDYVPVSLETELGDTIPLSTFGFKGELLATGKNEASFSFTVPDHWELVEGSKIILNIQKTIDGYSGGTNGGWLEFSLNHSSLVTLPLNANGDETIELTIPSAELLSANGRYSLDINLITSAGCDNAKNTSVSVLPSSYLVLPHQFVTPKIDLRQLPKPIQQGSFLPDRAFLILPDTPTTTELQAALILSAGFGRMMNHTDIQLIQYSELTDEIRKSEHIIAVGKSEQFPTLAEATSDHNLLAALDETDGLLQIANSPWNSAKVVLWVTGTSDAGVLKAAKAIGYGTIRTNYDVKSAVINEVYFTTNPTTPLSNSRTFSELGYDLKTLNGPALKSTSYSFFMPPGSALGENETAVLNLHYSHSQLIQYEQSGVNISLNGRPVYSIRLSDQTANAHDTLIELPSTLIQAGDNTITLQAALEPMDECSDLREEGTWFNIFPESSLYLPMTYVAPEDALPNQLNHYPQPYSFDQSLSKTGFVLPANSATAWFAAVQVAFDLGKKVDGDILDLQVALADNIPATFKQENHLIIIGEATQLPFLSEINNRLPAPFAENGTRIDNDRLPVAYEIPSAVDLGYLQLFPSVWNPQRSIILISGDSAIGIQNATIALLGNQRALNGDLAVIEPEGLFVTASEKDETDVIETAVSAPPTSASSTLSTEADESTAENKPTSSQGADNSLNGSETRGETNEETIIKDNNELIEEEVKPESDITPSQTEQTTSTNPLTQQGSTLPLIVLGFCLLLLGGLGFLLFKNQVKNKRARSY